MRSTIPTSAQIRSWIDEGQTREKVRASDPAAVPLGTDDEAAGSPPSPTERAMTAASLPHTRGRRRDYGFLLYALALSLVSAAILAIVLFS
jgi:hypothetical protein